MEELDKGADLRHPSINTEPRTLDENSIERATVAAQRICAQHPEPTSDCFTKMDEVRIRDSSISKNIDLYLEELKREQAAREKQNAERDTSETGRSGNGAMSLDEREGAGEEGEEDWEEEYLMLDLDDVFHGASIPSFTYTLSGLDTLNPILTLDNGLKLIGHYVETIGTAVVYSEKEKEAPADRWELPPPADPNAVNNEKRPLKQIRGVCKLERKLKFCAMPIAYAPARNDTSMGDTSFMKTAGADDASLVNAMQTQGAMPTDNASLGDARLKEGESLDSARSPEDGPPENAVLTEDELLRNDILIYSTSAESAKLREDVSIETIRPADDAPLENARSMEDVSLENARPEVNTILEYARAVEDVSLENAMPTENTSK